MDNLEILESEKENNKNLKEYVAYIDDQLNAEKNKFDSLEIQNKKNESKIKDITNDKNELEKKH